MRFRFFLCASADLGVRRTNVSSSFCSSGYIEILRIAQAAAEQRPLDCEANASCKRSEKELQCKLHQARIARLRNFSERGAVCGVTVRIQELRVIKGVE